MSDIELAESLLLRGIGRIDPRYRRRLKEFYVASSFMAGQECDLAAPAWSMDEIERNFSEALKRTGDRMVHSTRVESLPYPEKTGIFYGLVLAIAEGLRGSPSQIDFMMSYKAKRWVRGSLGVRTFIGDNVVWGDWSLSSVDEESCHVKLTTFESVAGPLVHYLSAPEFLSLLRGSSRYLPLLEDKAVFMGVDLYENRFFQPHEYLRYLEENWRDFLDDSPLPARTGDLLFNETGLWYLKADLEVGGNAVSGKLFRAMPFQENFSGPSLPFSGTGLFRKMR